VLGLVKFNKVPIVYVLLDRACLVIISMRTLSCRLDHIEVIVVEVGVDEGQTYHLLSEPLIDVFVTLAWNPRGSLVHASDQLKLKVLEELAVVVALKLDQVEVLDAVKFSDPIHQDLRLIEILEVARIAFHYVYDLLILYSFIRPIQILVSDRDRLKGGYRRIHCLFDAE
jgi:hypothetical protein